MVFNPNLEKIIRTWILGCTSVQCCVKEYTNLSAPFKGAEKHKKNRCEPTRPRILGNMTSKISRHSRIECRHNNCDM